MAKIPSLAELVDGAERSVAKRLRAESTRQSFSGTLKVATDKIYVGKKDGMRALESLRLRALKAG